MTNSLKIKRKKRSYLPLESIFFIFSIVGKGVFRGVLWVTVQTWLCAALQTWGCAAITDPVFFTPELWA